MAKRYPPCIMASCCIPWNEDYKIMEDLFREEIRGVAAQTKHVYILGTAGEGYALSESLFDRVVRIFTEEMRDAGGEPMVGLISLSTALMAERLEKCLKLGIKEFQISLPGWGALTRDEMFRFFEFMCNGYPEATFLHYNLARTKRFVEPLEYGELEKLHPNLAAAKITTDSVRYIGQLMEKSRELQYFFTDMGFFHASMVDECGLLIAMASSNWKTAKEYFKAAREGDNERALSLQKSLVRMNLDLRSVVGTKCHIDGAFDKMYVKLHHPEFPLRLYPPYADAGDEAFFAFKEMVKTKYPQWYPGDPIEG